MKKNLITAVLMTIATTLLLGILYPLLVTGLAQVIFPKKANGQLIRGKDGVVVGSRLIGQPFSGPGYFSFAAVRCGRCRLRRQRLQRLKSGTDQRAVDCSRQWRRRQTASRESRHAYPCRSGDDIGFRTGSAYLASGGGVPDSPRRFGTQDSG